MGLRNLGCRRPLGTIKVRVLCCRSAERSPPTSTPGRGSGILGGHDEPVHAGLRGRRGGGRWAGSWLAWTARRGPGRRWSGRPTRHGCGRRSSRWCTPTTPRNWPPRSTSRPSMPCQQPRSAGPQNQPPGAGRIHAGPCRVRTGLPWPGRGVLEGLLGELEEPLGGVRVQPTVVADRHPAEALVDLSADADLLVVGSRGHGGFGELLLGSVSHAVVLHAVCPVVIVPSQRDDRGTA